MMGHHLNKMAAELPQNRAFLLLAKLGRVQIRNPITALQ
jgi:hypothetical protein